MDQAIVELKTLQSGMQALLTKLEDQQRTVTSGGTKEAGDGKAAVGVEKPKKLAVKPLTTSDMGKILFLMRVCMRVLVE